VKLFFQSQAGGGINLEPSFFFLAALFHRLQGRVRGRRRIADRLFSGAQEGLHENDQGQPIIVPFPVAWRGQGWGVVWAQTDFDGKSQAACRQNALTLFHHFSAIVANLPNRESLLWILRKNRWHK